MSFSSMTSLIEALEAEERPDPGLKMTPSVQIERLRDYYALVYADPAEPLEPGDIVYHKYPQLSLKRHEGNPMVFIGFLDNEIKPEALVHDVDDASHPVAGHGFDCRVGFLTRVNSKGPNGGLVFVEDLAHSRTLTRNAPSETKDEAPSD